MAISDLATRKLAVGIASTSEAQELVAAINSALPNTTLTAFTDTITAKAGGTQATTPILTSKVNRVSTVATALDSVELPLAVGGAGVSVINDTSKTITVFGAGTDTINDAATATGVIQGPFSAVTYHCTTAAPAGKYYASNIGVGYQDTTSGAATLSTPVTLGIGASTAAAGTTFADAGALPAGTAPVYPTTAADGTKGVIINVADQVTGREIQIGNGVSNAILKVYGPSGAVINGAAANAAFSSVSGKGVLLVCLSGAGNTWLGW